MVIDIIDPNSLQILSILAQGGQATVFLAKYRDPSKKSLVAIKQYTNEYNPKEALILSNIHSKYVVKLVGHNPDLKWVVTKFYRGTTLENTYITSDIFKQIIQGCMDIHKSGYIHGDLKPSNILFTNGCIKICDFGVSIPIGTSQTFNGSYHFASPDSLLNRVQYENSDVFTLGGTLYYNLYGKIPWGETQPFIAGFWVSRGRHPILDLTNENDIIIHKCWNNEITLQDLIKTDMNF